ncbi:DUF4038 domain-containing protein [bacterium]|nr:DUF4038 domain-containing protein [bacterium]
MPTELRALQHQATEWAYVASRGHADPFNELELDVAVIGPDGTAWRVPAYWAGGQEWRVRFTAAEPGQYRVRTECTDTSDPSLHGVESALTVEPCAAPNALLARGPLRASEDRRHFVHADGTPFLWLGDTWWMGLCRRLQWPEEFQALTADRVSKGFSVIQIVAGLYPDMPAFDPRGANEAGFPWEEDYARVNPAYFDMADLRIQWLVHAGLVPCIVGFWAYHILWLGEERVKQHWRYLVARYAAYPVVWCLAGEGAMPYYLSDTREADVRLQKRVLTDLARYVHDIDPFHHPLTVHPTDCARHQVDDPAVLDFDMLQTGHGGHQSMANTGARLREAVAATPRMPALVGEVSYEGILEGSRQETQRLAFWACMLGGAAGHTYGANGIWQLNRPEAPFGPSPHGASWGNTPWQEAMRLPGSAHVGVGKRLLERVPWWQLVPHPEWVDPRATDDNAFQPYCAAVPGQVRVLYIPPMWASPTVKGIEPGVEYRASYFDPSTGEEHPLGVVSPSDEGDWPCPRPPVLRDWVLILDAR